MLAPLFEYLSVLYRGYWLAIAIVSVGFAISSALGAKSDGRSPVAAFLVFATAMSAILLPFGFLVFAALTLEKGGVFEYWPLVFSVFIIIFTHSLAALLLRVWDHGSKGFRTFLIMGFVLCMLASPIVAGMILLTGEIGLFWFFPF